MIVQAKYSWKAMIPLFFQWGSVCVTDRQTLPSGANSTGMSKNCESLGLTGRLFTHPYQTVSALHWNLSGSGGWVSRMISVTSAYCASCVACFSRVGALGDLIDCRCYIVDCGKVEPISAWDSFFGLGNSSDKRWKGKKSYMNKWDTNKS